MARNYKEGDTPVPGYKLLKFLGRGGFGEVWKATAPGGFEVALKIINLSGKPGQKELRALQVVKRLRHPHLIQVTAFWLRDEEGNVLPDPEEALSRDSVPEPTIQDTMIAPLDAMTDVAHTRPTELVIAMGLADQSLFDRLQECQRQGLAGIPTEELLGYMEDSARAIDYLNSPTHSFMGSEPMSVQHCDIKPHNILIVSGAAQVCDFGLARVMGDVQNSSAAAGTIAYAAPECIKEGKPSSTTDQYSLALSYLELKTGALPYDSETWMEVLTAVQQGNLNLSKLPQAEQVVVRRATAQNPSDRFPSTTAMVHALREAATGVSSVRRTSEAVDAADEGDEAPSGGLPIGLIAAGLAIVLALGAGGYFVFRPGEIAQKGKGGETKPKEDPPKKKAEVPPAKTEKALGDEKLVVGQFAQAIGHYDASLKALPDDRAVHFSRGLCYLNLNQLDKALEDFERAAELDVSDSQDYRGQPQYAEAYLTRGELRLMDDPAKARDDFEKVLKLEKHKKDARALMGRGKAFASEKNFDSAIRDFKAAGASDPKYAKSPELVLAYAKRAESKLGTDPKAAEADADEALKLDDKNPEGWLAKGTAKLEQERYQDSLADFSKVIDLKEKDSRGWSRRGYAYLQLKKYELAIYDLAFAIEYDGKTPHLSLLINLGKAHLFAEHYSNAVDEFAKVIQREPKNVVGYYLRGEAYRRNGSFDEALKDYDKALEIDKKHGPSFFGKGGTYQIKRAYPEALQNFTQALKNGYQDGGLFAVRAEVYNALNKKAEAQNDRDAYSLTDKIDEDGEGKDFKSRAALAFMLATSPFADFREGQWALELAKQACLISNDSDPASLDALAAAHAELGEFEAAVKWAGKAQELATDEAQKKAFGERLKMYEGNRPFRSPAPAAPASE